ncbi:MAG: hypothetical protein ACRDD1_09740, partial [Planctomycetia bacterium]
TLCDHRKAFAAYAAFDDSVRPGGEAYLSQFTFGAEMTKRADAYRRLAVKGYDGPTGADWLGVDIDAADLEQARRDVCRFVFKAAELLDADPDAVPIYFSGSKGFHAYLPTSLGGAMEPAVGFHVVARRLVAMVAAAADVRVDESVYDTVRAFRAPNTRHPKTGLFKRRFMLDELMHQSVDGILSAAKEPLGTELPDAPARSKAAADLWSKAGERAAEDRPARAAGATTRTRLMRDTEELIHGEPVDANRAVRVFSAAADLGGFGSPDGLAFALLERPALALGLSSAEVERQIRCGLERGRRTDAAGDAEPSAPTDPAQPVATALTNATTKRDTQEKGLSAAPPLATALANAWARVAPVAVVDPPPAPLEPVHPPIGAAVFFRDAKGRPCRPQDAALWTWEGDNPSYGVGRFPVERLARLAPHERWVGAYRAD